MAGHSKQLKKKKGIVSKNKLISSELFQLQRLLLQIRDRYLIQTHFTEQFYPLCFLLIFIEFSMPQRLVKEENDHAVKKD